MVEYGEVLAILNDQLVLISSSEELFPGDIIFIFNTIEDDRLKEIGVEKPIYYPKGKLRIVNRQTEEKYLAERFRDVEKRTRRILVPSQIAKSFAELTAQFQPEVKEITEEVPGMWSIEIDGKQTLNISITKTLIIGDLVGRL